MVQSLHNKKVFSFRIPSPVPERFASSQLALALSACDGQQSQPFQTHSGQNEIAIGPPRFAAIFHFSRRTLADYRGAVRVFVDQLRSTGPLLSSLLSSH